MTNTGSRAGGLKMPPYSVAAEKAVIGFILNAPTESQSVRNVLIEGKVFFRPEYGSLFDTVTQVLNERPDCSAEELRESVADVGPVPESELTALATSAPSAQSAQVHARTVAEKAKLRELIDWAASVIHDAYHTRASYEDLLADARKGLDELPS